MTERDAIVFFFLNVRRIGEVPFFRSIFIGVNFEANKTHEKIWNGLKVEEKRRGERKESGLFVSTAYLRERDIGMCIFFRGEKFVVHARLFKNLNFLLKKFYHAFFVTVSCFESVLKFFVSFK